MKVAIQLSGMPDNIKTSYPFFKKQILNNLSDYDIYIVSWTDVSQEYLDLIDTPYVRLLDQKLVISELSDLIKFCKEKHLWQDGPFYDRYRSTLLQYYQRYICNLFRKEYEKNYDIVIMTRPDLVFIEPMYEEYLEKMKDTLCIPTGSDWHQGINDLFAISNPDLMDKYNDLYLNIKRLVEKNKTYYHPEHILKCHLDDLNIKVSRFSFPLSLRFWRLNF